jgi:hypothetical protein
MTESGDLGTPSASKSWRQWAWIPATAIATTCAFFHRAVFSDQIFISRDIQRVYFPFRKYWAERVAQGEFPDWFPYDGLGQSFPGIVISGVFHPFNLLGLVFTVGGAIKASILLCFPIAALGVYRFARRWQLPPGAALFAGLLFAFSGYMICITNNLLYLMAAATFPWALWAADRLFERPSVLRGAVSGLLLALVLFAGDSQSFALCCAATALVALARHQVGRTGREVGIWLGLMAFTAGLCAVQVLPALGTLSAGKSGLQTMETSLYWSLHPLRFLEMAIGPMLSGNPGSDASSAIALNLVGVNMSTLWVESVHIGAPALLLMVCAAVAYRKDRRTWILVGCAVLIGLLALGKHAGLYALVWKLVPLWRPFRYPEKLLPYLNFLVCLGAGVGLAAALANPRLRRGAAVALFSAFGLCLALLAAERGFGLLSRHLSSALWSSGTPLEASIQHLRTGYTRTLIETAVACLLCGGVLIGVQKQNLAAGLIPAVVVGQLFIANEPLYEITLPDVVTEPTAFVEVIRQLEGPPQLGNPRVVSAVDGYMLPEIPSLSYVDRYGSAVATAMDPDTPAIWGIESANGYLPGVSRRFYQLAGQGRVWWVRHTGLVGARYMTVGMEFFEKIGGNADAVLSEHRGHQLLLLKNPTAKPRAYLTRPRCVAGPDEALALIQRREFQPEREAIVECAEPLPVAPAELTSLGQAAVTSYRPEAIDIQVEAVAEALLVLTDAYYPGWTVTVDGAPAEIRPANHAMRGIMLRPGAHQVAFRYRTPGLIPGMLISVACLVAGLGVGLVLQRRNT